MTDKWMNDRWMHRKIMLLLHTLTMRGSDVASLVEFRPVVLGDSVTDRQDGRGGVHKIPITSLKKRGDNDANNLLDDFILTLYVQETVTRMTKITI